MTVAADAMRARVVSSWGNVIRAPHAIYTLRTRQDRFPQLTGAATVLPFGNGRSYGDSCLNVGGALLQTRGLDHFIHFDRATGRLACEAGVLLSDILPIALAAGWFLPVVPGTAFVTVGGAIANDVHGKNHHRAGTFGCHVCRFELLRSNGERLICAPDAHVRWFEATIGGLGLTGVVTWAELQLRRIAGPWMDLETIRFGSVAEFFGLCAASDRDFEYTVAWIDCLARGKRLGRGLLQRANHAGPDGAPRQVVSELVHARRKMVPFVPPVSLINSLSLRAFNTLYYHWQRAPQRRSVQDFRRFFFPLDAILHWNRLYGPRGFYQYQCVVPNEVARDATRELLATIASSGLGSFLAVLKRFGSGRSPGMLSFPMEGVTLALDFPNSGAGIDRLFTRLDAIVAGAHGRVYPAKDGRMPASLFRSGFPRWREFEQYIDPAMSSSFWRRVMQHA
ncbi:MAG TPA: FAD-binding oxidoreductase [Steroidobacteraceae bacterium]